LQGAWSLVEILKDFWKKVKFSRGNMRVEKSKG